MYYEQPYQYQPNSDYFQQRASQLANGFPRPANPQTVFYTVSSIEEARNARIDNPMNTYFFMYNTNNKIYTKKIGDNGAAVFQSYVLENPPPIRNSEKKYLSIRKNTMNWL